MYRWLLSGELKKEESQRTEVVTTRKVETRQMQIQVTKVQESGEHGPDLPSDDQYLALQARGNAPPHFVQPLRALTKLEAQSACFEAKILGSPPLEVHWRLDNDALENGSLYEIVSDTREGRHWLHILELYPEDEGTYTCYAANPFGVASSSAMLTVITGVLICD